MTASAQIKVPAMYMRGGTSKGVFFRLQDLPESCRRAGAARDAFMLRVIGSPDPYAKQIDGMGGATSSTSKVVIVDRSRRPGHDLDYLFGQVAIDRAVVDWSGNCGNLSAAVGGFAIESGLLEARSACRDGLCTVRIWQANIGKTIIAQVPVAGGVVQENGDFELDGVTFAAAEVRLQFVDPAGSGEEASVFPTGNLLDELNVPGVGTLQASLINAGIATIFIRAEAIGCLGSERQEDINGNAEILARCEAIRRQGALRMGLIDSVEQAVSRQHTPKLVLIAPPQSYQASSGKRIAAEDIDLLARALSMGKLHHAMMGTAAVAIGTAAAIPGTLVNLAARAVECRSLRLGHPSGILQVGAEVSQEHGRWTVRNVSMSRSARVLMEGFVRVPANGF
jgi:probable AcnD-accessory protein PrpF